MKLNVPCSARVRVSTTSAAEHLCPYKDEADKGTVEIAWTTGSETVELHALAALVRARESTRISHEQWTEDLAMTISNSVDVHDVAVTSRWSTGGLSVEVVRRVHLVRQPINRSGA